MCTVDLPFMLHECIINSKLQFIFFFWSFEISGNILRNLSFIVSHCPGGYFISYTEADYITCGLSFIVSHCPGGYFISYTEAEYITCGLSFNFHILY